MHVLLTKEEFENRVIGKFPFQDGDSFVVSGIPEVVDKDDDHYLFNDVDEPRPLARYRYTEAEGLKVEVDFISHDRKATEADFADAKDLPYEDIVKWYIDYWRKYHEQGDYATPYAEYQVYTREFERRHKFFHKVCGFSGPDEDHLGHCAPEIMCDQNEPLEDHIAEYEKLIPFFEYADMGEDIGKAIHIDIFEHTCSEYGCYNAYVREDGTCVLMKTAYHHTSVVKEFSDYREMIEYIREHHPYRLKEDKSDHYDFVDDYSDDDDDWQ